MTTEARVGRVLVFFSQKQNFYAAKFRPSTEKKNVIELMNERRAREQA